MATRLSIVLANPQATFDATGVSESDPMQLRTMIVVFACVAVASGPAHPQDADTLKFDGRTYRFDGIDAPEIDQPCLGAEGEVYQCGRVAAEALRRFVADRPIRCSDLRPDPAYANSPRGGSRSTRTTRRPATSVFGRVALLHPRLPSLEQAHRQALRCELLRRRSREIVS